MDKRAFLDGYMAKTASALSFYIKHNAKAHIKELRRLLKQTTDSSEISRLKAMLKDKMGIRDSHIKDAASSPMYRRISKERDAIYDSMDAGRMSYADYEAMNKHLRNKSKYLLDRHKELHGGYVEPGYLYRTISGNVPDDMRAVSGTTLGKDIPNSDMLFTAPTPASAANFRDPSNKTSRTLAVKMPENDIQRFATEYDHDPRSHLNGLAKAIQEDIKKTFDRAGIPYDADKTPLPIGPRITPHGMDKHEHIASKIDPLFDPDINKPIRIEEHKRMSIDMGSGKEELVPYFLGPDGKVMQSFLYPQSKNMNPKFKEDSLWRPYDDIPESIIKTMDDYHTARNQAVLNSL